MLGGGAGEDVEMSRAQPPRSTFIGGRPREQLVPETHLGGQPQRVGSPAGVGGGWVCVWVRLWVC